MSVFSTWLHRLAKQLRCIPYFLADHNLFPIQKKRLCFISSPDYADNARVLFDYMIEHGYGQKYEIIWLVQNPENYPKGIKGCQVYKVNSVLGALKQLSSAYILSTHGFPHISPDRKGQICIYLGHGCGYKADAPTTQKMFDFYVVIAPLWINVYTKTFSREQECFLPLGYPRYDLLLHPKKDASAHFKELVGARAGEKVVFWMPTFRDTVDHRYAESKIERVYPLPGLKNSQELEELNEACQEANVILVIKRHINQVAWNLSGLSNIKLISNDDLEVAGIQLYESLPYTDALISDYSSVSIDYLLLDRPQGFVLDDYEQYAGARGWNLSDPLRYMPGQHIMNVDDMAEFIRSVGQGEDRYAEERARCRKELHREDAPESYCREILEYFHL